MSLWRRWCHIRLLMSTSTCRGNCCQYNSSLLYYAKHDTVYACPSPSITINWHRLINLSFKVPTCHQGKGNSCDRHDTVDFLFVICDLLTTDPYILDCISLTPLCQFIEIILWCEAIFFISRCLVWFIHLRVLSASVYLLEYVPAWLQNVTAKKWAL